MLSKAILVAKAASYITTILLTMPRRSISTNTRRLLYHRVSSPAHADDGETKNIVIVGASFAGLFAAETLARNLLPPRGRYRVVIVEPRFHFHFTWVLPRFCVVEGHEHKAFIPYPSASSRCGFFGGRNEVRWVRGRAVRVTRGAVVVVASEEEDGGEMEVPYEYLVLATGSGAVDATDMNFLPSRVGVLGKEEGMRRMRDMQGRIAKAGRLVVVGGGAAGVELAADAKSMYPEKEVVLVHSRDAVMQRFGPGLQEAALDGLQGLRVEVILGQRVVDEHKDAESTGFVILESGRRIECDFLIQDDSLPNVYACGDVAETEAQSSNARTAMHQAMVAANNILEAVEGRRLRFEYAAHWAGEGIKLTLGLDRSVMYASDGNSELVFGVKEGEVDLQVGRAWKFNGARPFEDPEGVCGDQSSGV